MINGAVTLNPKLTFENFIETALKDYGMFKGRLGDDCSKLIGTI